MNPLTKVKLINELNEREAALGVAESVSWHSEYRHSAWIFLGGLPYELTEGDVLCVFSQYGEIVNINLVRDKKTGKSKGFGFLCYEDQRSTILAVDNFNGIKIKGRTIRVDHVANYRPPKDSEDVDDVTKALRERGCGAETPPPGSSLDSSDEEGQGAGTPSRKRKKAPKEKKKKKKDKEKRVKRETPPGGSAEDQAALAPRARIKEEKEDPGYDKYARVDIKAGAREGRRPDRGRGEADRGPSADGRKERPPAQSGKGRSRERGGTSEPRPERREKRAEPEGRRAGEDGRARR
ncbi:RNA-binding motif protein, X-linked 2 [Tachyglossus aculeatus]|uniref:RNA-binding motif protein, X-linked 2 n=1 Tax=Tachyglossus aculeatus TaxID=9261 RepID=UPI0018F4FDA4|nr:RNA-binding motif protein, X-linked 2 [Tachyglossus aculeatus]